MWIRAHHPIRPCSSLAALAVIALGVASSSCATRTPLPEANLPQPVLGRMLVFENGTTEAVRLYLLDDGGERLIGHVQPGHTAVLRLPAAARLTTQEVSLVAVPPGTRRYPVTPSTSLPGAIRSGPVTSESVAAVRWRLTTQRLVSLPLPQVPR